MSKPRWNVMQNSPPPGEVTCHCQYKLSPNCTTSKAAYWLWSRRRSSVWSWSPGSSASPVKTFYKYRHQAAQGRLASCDCTPHVHGSAKPQHIIDAVLHAKAHYPNFGKQRLTNVLYHQGIVISPNTVQRILRQHTPPVPPVTCPPCHWSVFEALAPHVLWAMDICYLYTRKHDGFDRYLITILDDHSRTVIASGLYERQTVSEVVEVLKTAVLMYGVPQRLVCDH